MSSPSSRICLGVIVGAKGLRGEVRIKSFTEEPNGIAAYGPVETDDGRTFTVTIVGQAQGVVIARLKGVADRTAAEGLKGLKLYVDRKVLPAVGDGTYYHADLVGLAVVLATGESLGVISAVHNFGAGDILEVDMPGRSSELVPFSEAAVAAVDVKGGKVVMNALPGLFETDAAADEAERRKEGQEGGEAGKQ